MIDAVRDSKQAVNTLKNEVLYAAPRGSDGPLAITSEQAMLANWMIYAIFVPHSNSGSLENLRTPAEGAGDEAREKESTADWDRFERVENAVWLDYLGVPYVPPVNRDSDCDMRLRLSLGCPLDPFQARFVHGGYMDTCSPAGRADGFKGEVPSQTVKRLLTQWTTVDRATIEDQDPEIQNKNRRV